VGYALPSVTVPIDLTRDVRGGRSAFRILVERVTDRGRSRARDAPQYVYVTSRTLLRERGGNPADATNYAPREVTSRGGVRPVCVSDYQSIAPQGPFDVTVRAGERDGMLCWSLRSGLFGEGFRGLGRGRVGAMLPASVPFVVAAIDPDQEARLEGLDRAVVAGRYLRATDRPSGDFLPRVPVLVASRPTADEQIVATVQRLGRAGTAALGGGKRGNGLRRALCRAARATCRPRPL
jgi:putative ABC transport system permease protein